MRTSTAEAKTSKKRGQMFNFHKILFSNSIQKCEAGACENAWEVLVIMQELISAKSKVNGRCGSNGRLLVFRVLGFMVLGFTLSVFRLLGF